MVDKGEVGDGSRMFFVLGNIINPFFIPVLLDEIAFHAFKLGFLAHFSAFGFNLLNRQILFGLVDGENVLQIAYHGIMKVGEFSARTTIPEMEILINDIL